MNNQSNKINPIVSFPNAVAKTAFDVREIISCHVNEHSKNSHCVSVGFRNKNSHNIFFIGDSSELDAIAAWNLIIDTQRSLYNSQFRTSDPYR